MGNEGKSVLQAALELVEPAEFRAAGESNEDVAGRLLVKLYNERQKFGQVIVQLSACATAAQGSGDPLSPDQYAWSPAYQDVLKLRREFDERTHWIESAINLIGYPPNPEYPENIVHAVALLRYGKISLLNSETEKREPPTPAEANQ